MIIVILSLSKAKEFVKSLLYELFSPKGAYLTAEGTKYCRNCANNRLQFASRTMVFVETCQNLRRITWQDSTGYYLHTVSKSKWHETFTYWSRHPLPDTFLLMLIKMVWMRLISLIADSLVCPGTLKSFRQNCPEVQGVSTYSRGADMPLWCSQPRSVTFCDVRWGFLHVKAQVV